MRNKSKSQHILSTNNRRPSHIEVDSDVNEDKKRELLLDQSMQLFIQKSKKDLPFLEIATIDTFESGTKQ